jgi:hypothetical protein
MNSNTAFIFKTWLTSGILTPIVFILFLALVPSYHIPDMIGFVFIIYVFPANIILSMINICFIAIIISLIKNRYEDMKNIKSILAVTAVIVTFITILAMRVMKVLDPELNKDFALPISYSISILTGLYLFKLHSTSNRVFTNE